MVELAKQGLTPEQIRGSIRGILQLAQAGDIGISTAAEYALGAVRGMQLPMQTAEQMAASIQRMNDLIAFVAAKSSATAEDVAQAFKFAGPVMAATGSSPEHLGAMIMAMRNANIPGSEIGVAIRSMLVSLVKGGPSQQGAFARLGIDRSQFVTGRQITADNIISSLGLSGINATALKAQIEAAIGAPGALQNMAALTTRLTDIVAGSGAGGAMDRTAIASAMSDSLNVAAMRIDLFGLLRAIRDRGGEGELVNIFQGQQFARVLTALRGPLQEFLGQITSGATGYAQRVAETRMQGLPKAWQEFTAAIDSFVLKLADSGLRDAAINTLGALTGLIGKLTEFNGTTLMIGASLTAIAAVGGTVLAVIAGIARLVSVLSGMSALAALGTAGTAGVGAGTALGAGAAVTRAAALRMWLRRLGLAGAGYMGTDALWRWSGGADMTRRALDGPRAGSLEAMEADMRAFRERTGLDRGWSGMVAPMPVTPPSRDMAAELRGQLEREMGGATGGATAAAAGAGQAAGDAFIQAIADAIRTAAPGMRQQLETLLDQIRISPTITVTPRLDTSGLNGLHADTGVSATGR